MTILYLLSQKNNEFFQPRLKWAGAREVFLCPLEYGCEKRIEEIKAFLNDQGIGCEAVDFLTRFNQQAFAEKEKYIEFFAQAGDAEVLPAQSLKAHLRLLKNNFSLWWFSLIAEKNSCRSPNFTNLIKIKTISQLKVEFKAQQIWMDQDFQDMGACLRQVFGSDEIQFLGKKRFLFRFKNSLLFLFLQEQLRAINYFLNILLRAVM